MRLYKANLAFLAAVLIAGGAANAQSSTFGETARRVDAIYATAVRLFPDMPEMTEWFSETGDAPCGIGQGDHFAPPRFAFCTTENVIFERNDSFAAPQEPYELAHVLGHAVQVRHGVADVALREITRRRDEEDKLRGWVTRQVECIAGVLFHEAGLPETDLRALYDVEPMTDSHWGRDPLAAGPKVSIGLAVRAEWFSIGQRGDLSACAVGEFGSELLLEALRD